MRDETKYDRMLAFGSALPAHPRPGRRATSRLPGLPREKVLATVVRLLETTLIRVGNEEYARDEPVLRPDHAARPPRRRSRGATVRLRVPRQERQGATTSSCDDRRLARIVGACQDLPGQELFQYLDEDGERHAIDSADVNDYLREITGERLHRQGLPHLGRHRAGRAWRCREFERLRLAGRRPRSNVVAPSSGSPRRLGNTPAVCRKCYVHPAVLDAYLEGRPLAQQYSFRAASGQRQFTSG